MNDDLLGYYEQELRYFHRLGAEFAEKYPKIAGRLALSRDRCEDPHVERLIQAFAFIAGRIHKKLDDDLPEVAQSLLNILYPHYLAPIPSMSIVRFVMDSDQARLQTGQTIPRDSILSSKPVEGVPCRFRTCYPVTIWPMEITSAGFEPPARLETAEDDVRAILRLELRVTANVPLSELRRKISETEKQPIDRLRFYLQGGAETVYALYEMLSNNTSTVELKSGSRSIRLGSEAIEPRGFDPEDAVIPYDERSFGGYRLLQEYFALPEKFLFLDIHGLDQASAAGFGESFEILFHFNREFKLERSVSEQTFRLHCTPAINLFRQVAEPISVTHRQYEYRVVPDLHLQSAMEIFSIDSVTSAAAYDQHPVAYRPFYSIKHHDAADQQETFWYSSRRPSPRKGDEGSEMYITLVDLNFNPSLPDVQTLTVAATCTNRDLPSLLPFGTGNESDLQLEGAGLFTRITCLNRPSPTIRPAVGGEFYWRLVSHLALNYLSLVENDGGKGLESLREILRLYDCAGSSATQRQISGITSVSARRVFRRLGGPLQHGFVRGLEVVLTFDEQQFVGSGAFLFASVLERFLALYTSVNSFVELVATTRQREGILKRWPPRAAEQIVL